MHTKISKDPKQLEETLRQLQDRGLPQDDPRILSVKKKLKDSTPSNPMGRFFPQKGVPQYDRENAREEERQKWREEESEPEKLPHWQREEEPGNLFDARGELDKHIKKLSQVRSKLSALAIDLTGFDAKHQASYVFNLSKHIGKVANDAYLGPDYYLGPLNNIIEEVSKYIDGMTYPGTAEIFSHEQTPGLRIYHPEHLERAKALNEERSDQPYRMILFLFDKDTKTVSIKDSTGALIKNLPIQLDSIRDAVETRLASLWGELVKQKNITPIKKDPIE
ncbi:MAG: hypothetical protein ACTSU6_08215 [Candidatus Njordarchaeales archaeon]